MSTTATQVLLSAWTWEPSVIGGCVLLVAGYGVGWAAGGSLQFRPLLFLTGVLILLLALVSPLDRLGDIYLFSAHMAQHLPLIEVVPPLLLIGVTPAMYARFLAWRPLARAEVVLGQPVVAWLVGVGTVWVWHAPGLYNAALVSENVHVVEHLSFLVAATMFWWPVVAPLPELQRLPIWAAAGYLAAGALASSVLGIILTFSPPGIYPAYLHPDDTLGLLPLLRNDWGLTPSADQRLGGGLMWMLGSLVYLFAIVLSIGRWFAEADSEFEAADAPLANNVLTT